MVPIVLALAGLVRADSLNVRYIGGCDTRDVAWDLAVSGDYAYIADYEAGLCVVSIADPAHPYVVGHLDTPKRVLAVAVIDDHAYVAIDDSGMLVMSVVDPANLVEIGRTKAPGGARGVAVAGDYAYVAVADSGLRVISVADPANPVVVGSCSTPGRASGVTVAGGYAYVAGGDSGLRVVSIADPLHPVEVAHCSVMGYATKVSVSGDYAYAAAGTAGLPMITVVDPLHPVEVGRGSVQARGVAAEGGLAYATAGSGGLRVFSVVDPALPVEVGYHYTKGLAQSVAVAGHFAYIADMSGGLQVLQFYGGAVGDLDIDGDSLDVVADTVRLAKSREPGPYGDFVLGELVLVNTSTSYNPDTTDGPSTSPLDSLSFTGLLTGSGRTLDSILILNLPGSLAQGQAVVCTLAVYAPGSMAMGQYTGRIIIAGFDSLRHRTADTVYAQLKSFGDLDVDSDSLDVTRDTIRIGPRLASAGPPPTSAEYALGRFILANTSESYNPDTADGPSRSWVDPMDVTGSLSGPGGTLDSLFVAGLSGTLAQGQSVECTLAVYLPPFLQDGDYAGTVTVVGKDSAGMPVEEAFYALMRKQTLGDLDVDGESLDVVRDTANLHKQPAGPVYSPYAKAEFMLVNTYEFYNPDPEDGPSQSKLRQVKAKVEGQSGTLDSIHLLNLPESLAVGQAVECTLAVVLPDSAAPGDYGGWVAISATDTLGYAVRDSFFLKVYGPLARGNLDSLRVAPIPFKPYQNPEHDAIHFQGLTSGARVTVYDASGQSVWSATESGDGHLKWDAKVASGIYVYLVVAQDGASKVGKLSVIR